MSIRLILADDHEQFRQTLRALLERQEDIRVLAGVGDGIALTHTVERCVPPPDLIITDVAMMPQSGIETVRLLRASHPDIRILALSMHDESRFVAAMLAAGASSYMLKSDPFDVLLHAIRATASGASCLSPQLTYQ
ncbi:MAG: response regulator transcription factor [Burkholderiales bacterium]